MKTWLIDSLRNIQKRFVSWLSIVTIVLIGTTLILGLYFASSTVRRASLSYIDEQNFRDFDISSSIGIKQEDVDKIKTLPEVKDAEGQITFYGIASFLENNSSVTIVSITKKVSIPTVTSGALPTAPNECAISYSASQKIGAGIGDEIALEVSSARFSDVLPNKTYKITGIASHPDYMVNTSTDYVVLPPDSFDVADLSFDYSNILVDADVSVSSFDHAYQDQIQEIKEVLEKESVSIADRRATSILSDLEQEYDSAEIKIRDELAKGKAEIDKNRKTYEDAIAKALEALQLGEKEFEEKKATAEKELSEAARKIKEGEEEYNTQIADGQAQLEQGEKDLEKELNDTKYKLFYGMLELDKAERFLKEKEEEYSKGLDKLCEAQDQLNEGREKYNAAAEEVNNILSSDVIDVMIVVLEELGTDSDGTIATLEEASACSDPCERCKLAIKAYDEAPNDDIKTVLFLIDENRSYMEEFISGKEKLDEGEQQFNDGKAKLEEARKELDDGWYSLHKSQEQLAQAEAEFAKREPEARQKLEDAKAEFEQKKTEGAKQLEDAKKALSEKSVEVKEALKIAEEELSKGKAEYDVQIADGEKALKEADEQYAEAKKEADDKLSEVRDQIEAFKQNPCIYMVRTRDVNFPYVQTNSFIKAISGFFGVFTPLYSAIVAIVCFFTMTIIIEEQTSQIGTCKAFGMYEHEITRKYIVFGTTGALLGAVLGVLGAFAIEKLLIDTMRSTLAFSLEGIPHDVPMIILLPALEVLITVIAVLWSCRKYVKCSAVGLINGNEPVKRYRSKAIASPIKGVYFKLILSNLMTDVGRETVSIAVIIMCVFLVGFGIDIKMAYEGALSRQMTSIWQYDLALTESGIITDEERKAIKEALSGYDTIYLPVTASVIGTGDSQIITTIICVNDKENFSRFYSVIDEHGKEIQVPDEGVLATKEMSDKNHISKGATINLVGGDLRVSSVDVMGNFMLYAGKTLIMTSEFYEEELGTAPISNTYYIKAPKESIETIRYNLEQLPGVSSVSPVSDLRESNMAVVTVYNAVVAIVIIFSILLSFMILLNLSNILVAHRMRELLTMRVNGFSNMQVIGYLVREVLLTTTLAMLIALALGVQLTGKIIQSLETDAFMFVREPFAMAWTASVLINTLFSVVINYLAFSKVNKVPLTDIAKY